MSRVTIDGSGVLLVDGSPVFPICVSNPPPVGRQAPSGQDGWQELQAGGVSFVRTGRSDWNAQQLDAQIAAERTLEDAAAQHGLHCWLWLGSLPNLPPAAAGQPPSPNEQLLRKVVAAFEAHPGLGAYKGVDEPLHGGVPAAGLVRAYRVLRAIDPAHPVVVVQAPLGTVAELTSTVQPALLAPDAGTAVTATAAGVELATRQNDRFVYVITVRRGGATTRVGFSGLPHKHDGSPITGGQVLFEYVQDPLPPPIGAGCQTFRSVGVANGAFEDWFGTHDAHVYRFTL